MGNMPFVDDANEIHKPVNSSEDYLFHQRVLSTAITQAHIHGAEPHARQLL